MALSKGAKRAYDLEYRRRPAVAAKNNKWAADRMRRRSAVLALVKLTAGCVDCGYDAHAEALDFDHRPDSGKRKAVSQLRGCAWPTIWEEVMKCDVRCANCHRIQTAERRDAAA